MLFDEYQLSFDEMYYSEGAKDLLTRVCMRQRGFDWSLVQRTKSGDWRNRRRYGVIELAVAKGYGYHAVPGLLAPVQVYDEKVRRENRLSDHAWVAAEDPANGCERKANDQLWNGGIPYDTSQVSKLNGLILCQAKLATPVRQSYASLGRLHAQLRLPIRFTRRGYSGPRVAKSRSIGPREVAVAVEDVRCNGRHRFVQALATAEASLQRTAIARHDSYFQRVRGDKNRYLRRARSILTAAGRSQ